MMFPDYIRILYFGLFWWISIFYLWYKRKRMGGHLLEYNENTTNIKDQFKKLKNKSMIPEHIEHIGIAVPSIEEALPYYEKVLGMKCYSIEEVADQKVRTAFLKVGEVKLELLEPTSPESTIAKFIEKNGGRGGVHHIAYSVKDIEDKLKQVEENGVRSTDKPRAAQKA